MSSAGHTEISDNKTENFDKKSPDLITKIYSSVKASLETVITLADEDLKDNVVWQQVKPLIEGWIEHDNLFSPCYSIVELSACFELDFDLDNVFENFHQNLIKQITFVLPDNRGIEASKNYVREFANVLHKTALALKHQTIGTNFQSKNDWEAAAGFFKAALDLYGDNFSLQKKSDQKLTAKQACPPTSYIMSERGFNKARNAFIFSTAQFEAKMDQIVAPIRRMSFP